MDQRPQLLAGKRSEHPETSGFHRINRAILPTTQDRLGFQGKSTGGWILSAGSSTCPFAAKEMGSTFRRKNSVG